MCVVRVLYVKSCTFVQLLYCTSTPKARCTVRRYFRTPLYVYSMYEGRYVLSYFRTKVLPSKVPSCVALQKSYIQKYFRKYFREHFRTSGSTTISAFYLSSKIFSYSATYGTRLHDYTCTYCTCTVHALCARVCSCVRVRVRVEL